MRRLVGDFVELPISGMALQSRIGRARRDFNYALLGDDNVAFDEWLRGIHILSF